MGIKFWRCFCANLILALLIVFQQALIMFMQGKSCFGENNDSRSC